MSLSHCTLKDISGMQGYSYDITWQKEVTGGVNILQEPKDQAASLHC